MPITIRIKQHPFVLSRQWTEGHRLTAGEAQALTQLFAENVRNNCAKWVERECDDGGELSAEQHLALQDRIAAYAEQYQFTARPPAPVPIGPVERHAKEIAQERGRIELGLGPDEPVPSDIVTKYEQTLEVQQEARRRASAEREAARQVLAELVRGGAPGVP
jgi:hypothetical protein